MAPAVGLPTLSSTEGAEHEVNGADLLKQKLNGNHARASEKDLNGVMGPKSPLPKVGDLDSKAYTSNAALVEDIVRNIRLSGGCVVRQLVSKETLDAIEKEVRPHLDAAEPWNGERSP